MMHLVRTVNTILLSTLLVSVAAWSGEPSTPNCSAIANSERLLGPGKVLLLGELHGTNESPEFVAALACNTIASGRDLVLGLELPVSMQSDVNHFLNSRGGSEDRARLVASSVWLRQSRDGRTSRAMVRLLDTTRRLRRHGVSVEALLFDSGGPGQERERGMASNIISSVAKHPQAMHLILTGNLHSRVSQGGRGNSDFEPMGYLIRTALPQGSVTSLNVSYEGGTAWVCNPGCGISSLAGSDELAPGTIAMDDKTRPSGHAGWYGVGRVSASPPAAGAYCRDLFEQQLSSLGGDYRAFDQTPDEGWRKLGQNECLPEAVELIDRYVKKNPGLTTGDRRILSFHAGQLLARDGDSSAAIPRFEAAIRIDEPEDASFRWNAYVRATIAFLRSDRDALIAQREQVARSAPRGGAVPNLNVVDRLIDGFGRSYRAAYSGPPRQAPADHGGHEAGAISKVSTEGAFEPWQGFWQAYQYDSRAWTIRIVGESFHGILGPDDWYKGTLTIRTDRQPAEIDFHIEECRCSYEGATSEGIFRWDGETIVLSAPQPGTARSTTFGTDSGRVVHLKQIEE